jgi:hypothetical protein
MRFGVRLERREGFYVRRFVLMPFTGEIAELRFD